MIKELEITEQNPVIVLVVLTVNIEVYGKGKGYAMSVEVEPTDTLDILRSKVHFFKLFWQRKHQLVQKSGGKVLEDLGQSFKDCGISDNDTLMLKEAPRGGKASNTGAIRQSEEEEEKVDVGE